MRRGQYGRRIEFHTHRKFGGNVPIYLDTADGIFTAVIGELKLKDKNLEALRALVDKELEKAFSIEWIPVIEIGFGSRWMNNCDDTNEFERHLQLQYQRYQIAKKPDGWWISCTWGEDGDRLQKSKRFDPFVLYNHANHQHSPLSDAKLPFTQVALGERPTYYLPYTEPLWDMLKELGSRFNALEKRIIEVLGSEKKREQLIANVGKLLPFGGKP